MQANAVTLKEPKSLSISRLHLNAPTDGDIVVDVKWSGISTGTERLLWSGRMPPFPGLGYPLVPGYETVGEVIASNADSEIAVGDTVFVPGASCYKEAKGLFGGASSRLVTAASRAITIDRSLGENGVLLALAATAYHAVQDPGRTDVLPDLIVGHGVLGRLLARLTIALGGAAPTVWETNADRHSGAAGYSVCNPDDDDRRDYRRIYDVSGDADLLDTLIGRLAPGGEIVLAGFYDQRPSFAFPPAFMREIRLRIAAEWKPADLVAVRNLIDAGTLDLNGLITHRQPAKSAQTAYVTAFEDSDCLKMILDWETHS